MTVVYTFPNGFAREASATFGWLQHANLHPTWARTEEGSMAISLPAGEVQYLRLMQRHNPARFGNAPVEEVTA